MKVAKTLKYKITSHTRIFDETLTIYNEALSFIIRVIDQEFPDLQGITSTAIVAPVEKLIHRTKSNPSPKYPEFNERFYKFPSYLRRSAIASAFGKVKSYRSLYKNWEQEREEALANGKKFTKRAPTFQVKHQEFPVLYKGNMFKHKTDTSADVKVFYRNDWVWITVTFKGQDLYKRDVWGWKENNPTLVRAGKKYFLHISYQTNVTFKDKELTKRKICAVDLGINQSAVCSVIDATGTVFARKFINQAKEKDRLFRLTNKLRKAQATSGWIKAPNYWRQLNGIQTHIVNHTSHEIVAFAKEHDCDVIVFEYLGNMRPPKGFYGAKRLRFKLRYWRQIGIQNKVQEMAHYQGIRISRINPRNTSKLAFDGSGEVKRNFKNGLATFTTGKVYHADLSASYNIGARYFIREYEKTTTEKQWLSLRAKVPALAKRTWQTLSSLISLHMALA